MLAVDLGAIAVAVAICLVVALLGNLPSRSGLKSWYPTLAKPRFTIPTGAFIAVGGIVYLIDAVILYRLLVYVRAPEGQVITLVSLLVVMAFNELWNLAFFGLRSTLAGFVGIAAFLAPMTILMVALIEYDRISALLLAPYCVWVLYDLAWAHRLWRMNPSQLCG